MSDPSPPRQLRYKTKFHADLENESGSTEKLKFHVISPCKLSGVEIKFSCNEIETLTTSAQTSVVANITPTSVIANTPLPQISSQTPQASSSTASRINSAPKQTRKKPNLTQQSTIQIDSSEEEGNNENKWKIVVQTPARKRIGIFISPAEKIEKLKKILEQRLGISQKDQLLHFMNHSLNDQKTISEIKFIKNGSTLILDNKQTSVLPILIRQLCATTINLQVKQNDDVKMIKTRIHDIRGICPRLMRLIYAGKDLKDEESLSKYNIAAGTCLHLILRLVPLCDSCKPSTSSAAN